MTALATMACVTLIAWIYLLGGHGRFWITDQRLPASADPADWPDVVAVVPARNEADVLPLALPSVLEQDYAGSFQVVLVDDQSSDGTAAVALAEDPHGVRLTVVRGTDPPPGWAGKVWAMSQGLQEAGDPPFVLFCDADIALAPGTVAELVRAAQTGHLDLVSQMARLHATTFWERTLIPAFVYFFAQLYPFRRVNRPRPRTAAAAGGCMLVRRTALAAAGGLERIRGALIDDVSLARLMKRGGGRIWLGHGGPGVQSVRPHPRLSDLWDMVARSASTQLRHSPALVAGTVVGLLLVYLGPPVATVAGLATLPSTAGRIAAVAGAAAWVLMAVTYVPTLRMYGLSPLRSPALPLVAVMYTGMTVDSGRRHWLGRGGRWKGRPEAG